MIATIVGLYAAAALATFAACGYMEVLTARGDGTESRLTRLPDWSFVAKMGAAWPLTLYVGIAMAWTVWVKRDSKANR
jgi:hypothetical protein